MFFDAVAQYHSGNIQVIHYFKYSYNIAEIAKFIAIYKGSMVAGCTYDALHWFEVFMFKDILNICYAFSDVYFC